MRATSRSVGFPQRRSAGTAISTLRHLNVSLAQTDYTAVGFSQLLEETFRNQLKALSAV